jgi:hypothetical protein
MHPHAVSIDEIKCIPAEMGALIDNVHTPSRFRQDARMGRTSEAGTDDENPAIQGFHNEISRRPERFSRPLAGGAELVQCNHSERHGRVRIPGKPGTRAPAIPDS